jgi:hypothetical protein
MWQDNLVVTSTRSVDQDVLSPSSVTPDSEFAICRSNYRLDALSEALVDTNKRYFAHGGRFERYSCKTRM